MWEVEQNADGTFDVRKDGRAVAYDLDDWEIPAVLRRGEATGYTMIHLDGYRERVGM